MESAWSEKEHVAVEKIKEQIAKCVESWTKAVASPEKVESAMPERLFTTTATSKAKLAKGHGRGGDGVGKQTSRRKAREDRS